MENFHKEHRKRMRTKYEKLGESVFETHQLLEMMLFGMICMKDTNSTAHGILNVLPDGDIFSASVEDLCRADGVGKIVASELKISADTVRRLICDNIGRDGLDSEFSRRLYIFLKMLGKPYESKFAAILSPKNKVLDFFDVTADVVPVDAFIEKIVKKACALGGDKLILCHSHGKKTVEMSAEDLYMTAIIKKKMEESGSGIAFAEHYIVNDKDCIPCRVEI